jgi:hypothetical protein
MIKANKRRDKRVTVIPEYEDSNQLSRLENIIRLVTAILTCLLPIPKERWKPLENSVERIVKIRVTNRVSATIIVGEA